MNTKNQIKTKTKTYTTSEMASICGVTVGSISVFIKKNNLKPTKTGQNNAKYYDDSVLKQLRLHYEKSKSKRDKTSNNRDLKTDLAVAQSENQLLRDQLDAAKSTIEILRNELKIKNSQIDKLQDLTNQAQRLDLATHTQHQELLEQKSTQQTDEPTKQHKHGFFNWF
uniref:MerR family transcriptional regulator n=1 Tax=Limosilactobacillus reuteri TaxID=1598 RepID=UPI00155DC5B9|nr:MerR family transcriptional regulator [Limosilactobacillus reuteri]